MKDLSTQLFEALKHQVSYDKTFKSPDGIEFKLLPPEAINDFDDSYERTVAKTHIMNVGCIIVDTEYGSTIDMEYTLDDIYNMIEHGKCK